MGVEIYPRIENTTAAWLHEISGKALAKGMERLSKLVKKQGHKDLMDYYVPSQEDLEILEVEAPSGTSWFDATEGIDLINAMTRAFQEHRREFEYPENLEEDLKCFRKILDRAASEGLRWNIGMSY